jgi:PAS domain S-box-containing protein/putative nucleotidyltransferase with HDIG domain
VALASDRANAFDEFDLAITAFVAKLAGAAWERMRQEEGVRLRNTVLSSLARVTERLSEEKSWDAAMDEVVEQLGTALGCSRCYLFEVSPGPGGEPIASQRYEWVAPGITPQIANPQLQAFALREGGFARWCRLLGEGKPVVGLVREFPESEQQVLADQGIQSILVVPIVQRERWWGFLGFDDCDRPRDWTRMEIDTLKTAASALGVAIRASRLRAHERLHVRMLDAISQAIIATDPDGRIATWNRGAARMLGWTQAEVLGRSLAGLPLGPGGVMLQQPVAAATRRAALSVCDRHGRDLPVLCTTMALPGSDGLPPRIVHVLEDVSELHGAQRRAQESAHNLQIALEGTTATLLRIVETCDPALARHQQRTAELALSLARRLDLDRDRQRATWMAALLHDIGKLSLPAALRTGEEPQEAAACQVWRDHVRLAHHMLTPLDHPWRIATIAGQHHERPDGGGFPARLEGSAILCEAAIIALADFLEHQAAALQADGGRTLVPALETARRERGRRFDPQVVDALLALADEQSLVFPIRERG